MIELKLKSPQNNLVAVTGLPRSGKSMLAPIVSSLNKSENLQTDYTLEQFPVLNHLGLMSEHIAIYLMRYLVNFKIYDHQIGRNSNFRFTDWTSIWNTNDPRQYIRRLIKEEGDSVFKKIKEERRLNVYMFHNAFWHAKIYFKAFSDIKIIHIDRHPIDIVYSWYKRGYGDRFYDKERSALTLIKYKGRNLPYCAKGWEEKYCKLSDMDKIINMIFFINSNHNKSFIKLSEKNQSQVMIINFDIMVTKPNNDLKRITEFLNTDKTVYTKTVMDRERCPRKIDINERAAKFEEIKELAISDSVRLLQEMVHEYELQSSE